MRMMFSEINSFSIFCIGGSFLTCLFFLIIYLTADNPDPDNRRGRWWWRWSNDGSNSITESADACCWCCRRKKSSHKSAQKHRRERISKELINSFAYQEDDDEDDDGDDEIGCAETYQRRLVPPPAPELSAPSNLDPEAEDELMRQLQQPSDKITDNYYYVAKLNECLNETNRWYQYQNMMARHEDASGSRFDPDGDEEEEKESLIRSAAAVDQGRILHHQPQSICDPDSAPIFDVSSATATSKNRSRNLLKQQAIYTSFALKNNSKTFEMYMSSVDKGECPAGGSKKLSGPTGNDLISLAEKGRIGKQTSTDGSVSSETGSADDCMVVHSNKRSLLKRLKTDSSETTASTATTNKDHHPPLLKYQSLGNYYNENNYESDTQSSNLPDFSPNGTLSEPNIGSIINGGGKQSANAVVKQNVGRLEISFAYDAPTKRLCVTVIQGDDLDISNHHRHRQPAPVGQVCHQVFVKILLLPHKKQKFRTKCKPIFCPVFDESFTFGRIGPDEISDLAIRFRVFSTGPTRKTHLIGESRISFAFLKPQQQETKLWFALELPNKRNRLSDLDSSSLTRTDSTSSQSVQNSSPELLMSLSYNGTTGRLSVTIIKGSQFRSVSTRAPDTYVKLLLISQSGNEMARGKTRVCRGQPNPLFRETFVFQVALFQLPDVTLMMFVYNKRSIKRKEMIGWISLGYNSSGDEELSHWNDMRDNKGEQVSRWHVLHEPS